ncbi:DUF4382 domain-containing protein [Hymenobacter metallicola]|uniref:DUF4382 domain-containing protein n=1 Tax=Hymenobacter metallicola TaxID=2563114 RepID=A0A4Z0QDC7_9BACT|nr:DUF4382 domain-containing protein [Hymenobacter metallicola]TGE26712.1 DUF4382 domain-containing protein [Hymenobacter metallicola]
MKTHLLCTGLLAAVLLTGCEDAMQDAAVQPQASTTAAKQDPNAYQAVNIDLVAVEVSQDTDENTSSWSTLPGVQPGLRNLLTTTSSASPLFTSAAFEGGTIKQLRLILGENSTIRLANGTTVPLETPSGQTSGLKLKVNATVTAGVKYAVLAIINPNKQVVARGNGRYNLKPVLDGNIVQGSNGSESELRASLSNQSEQR